jgi:hypothetical protein
MLLGNHSHPVTATPCRSGSASVVAPSNSGARRLSRALERVSLLTMPGAYPQDMQRAARNV